MWLIVHSRKQAWLPWIWTRRGASFHPEQRVFQKRVERQLNNYIAHGHCP